jgi:hypothetical protein
MLSRCRTAVTLFLPKSTPSFHQLSCFFPVARSEPLATLAPCWRGPFISQINPPAPNERIYQMLLETQNTGFAWPDPAYLPPGHSPYSREHARKHGYVAQIDLQGEAERASFYRLEVW